MSSKDSPLLFAGRYRLERPIGSGRTSTVWRGWDETLDRVVAVKVVSVSLLPHRKLCARLLRETRTAAGLTHPGLPFIYDFGEASVSGGGETPYVVMEFLEGESLAARLARGPLPSNEASRVCLVTANALATAHEAGLVHRQLRPTKIFLTENGVKLLGLGTSQAVDDPRAGFGPSKADTSPYIAPEQLAGRPVTPAADVYALGIVLAEALTGRLPSEAALPSNVPDGIPLLCKRCSAADPGARPTAAQMAKTLTAPAAATPAVTTAIALRSYAGPPVPAKRSRLAAALSRATTTRRNRVVMAAAPIVLLMLVLGASGFVLDSPSSPEANNAITQGAPGTATITDEPNAEPTSGPTAGEPTSLEPTAPEPTSLEPTPAPTTRTPKPRATARPSQAQPEPTQTTNETPRPRAPQPTPQQPQISPDQALNNVRQSVSEGVNAGEIRQDVGLDLNNVISNLQRDLAGGQQVNLSQRVGEIRNKISTRFSEGGITLNRANTLISLLPKV